MDREKFERLTRLMVHGPDCEVCIVTQQRLLSAFDAQQEWIEELEALAVRAADMLKDRCASHPYYCVCVGCTARRSADRIRERREKKS